MKSANRKKLNSERITRTKESENSFLIETSFNSDIDPTTRKEIEEKYKNSKTNSEYIFPRVARHKKAKSKQMSTKNSFESLGKFIKGHKTSKSNAHQLIGDFRIQERIIIKKPSFSIKLPSRAKIEEKKSLGKYRGISYRQIKTDRNCDLKSPKTSKKGIEVYSKGVPLSCKKSGNSELMNKIFTPYNSNIKLLNNAASMRLKKIYHNAKQNHIN